MASRNGPPDLLPQDVRDHPAVVDACRNRDIGRLFRVINNLTAKPTQFTASHIARRCALSPTRVAEYMSGRRSASSLDVIQRVTDGLGIPGTRFGLAPRPWEGPEADEMVSNEPGFAPEEEEAADLAMALGRSNVAPDVLRLWDASVARVTDTYASVPPSTLLTWARQRLRTVTTLLSATQPIDHRRRLCALACRIAGLRAWIAHDLRQPLAATAFYEVAATAAREADDQGLYAWVLGNRGRLPIYADKPGAALDLALEALDCTEGHPDATMRAWLWAQASRSYTALGNKAAGARALVQAELTLDRRTTGDRSLVYFDGCRLTSFVGHHHLLAGQPQKAEGHLRATLGQLRPEQIKHLSLTRLDLATALVGQGELPEACVEARAALNIPDGELIDAVVRRALRLERQFRPHARHSTVVADVVALIDGLAWRGARQELT